MSEAVKELDKVIKALDKLRGSSYIVSFANSEAKWEAEGEKWALSVVIQDPMVNTGTVKRTAAKYNLTEANRALEEPLQALPWTEREMVRTFMEKIRSSFEPDVKYYINLEEGNILFYTDKLLEVKISDESYSSASKKIKAILEDLNL